eukprot:403367048
MEGGRSWQRGSSKNARGNSQNRQLSQPYDQSDIDPMMSTVQKSHIASILQGARSTVGTGNEMTRPFTPGDLPRHLFSGDDYSNRPGSSYKMKNIVGQAIDEFTSAVGNQSTSQNTTTSSGNNGGGIQMIQGNKIHLRSGSQNKDQNIMNVLQKHGIDKKTRGNFLPAIQPITKDSIKNMGAISRQQVKGFDSSKPIKGQQQFSQDNYNTANDGISSRENLMNQSSLSSASFIGSNSGSQQKTVVKLKKNPVVAQTQDVQEGASSKSNQQQLPPRVISSHKLKKQGSSTKADDYSDLVLEGDEVRTENQQKYDQSKMENLIKMQKIQQEIKQANRNRDDLDGEGEDEDQYEDYFENQMQLDMQGVESYEQQIDYGQALEKIQRKVQKIDQEESKQTSNNLDDIDDEYLSQNIQEDQMNGYAAEYYEVINEMSRFCSIISKNQKSDIKDKKQVINEEEIIELCPRIYTLATEHEKQMLSVQQQCFLETLLKGSFSLLSVKHSKSVLRLSACNIHLFLKIFDRYCVNLNSGTQADFKKLYNYLFETMKVLLVYAKEKKNDILFKTENLIPQLSRVLHQCFLERSDVIIKLTSHVVNKKEIVNEDLIYDLVNYIIGSIKCFTQQNLEVQSESIKQRYILLLSKCMQKAMNFGTNMSKKAQNLVQICGALRNLSNDDSSYEQICSNGIIQKLVDILEKFQGHQELMINVSRIMSKVSMDNDCSFSLIQTNKIKLLIDLLFDYQNIRDFPVRMLFVLANITTYFEEAREQIGNYAQSFNKILSIAINYFDKEELLNKEGEKTIEDPKNPSAPGRLDPVNNQHNVEDNLIKLIRLIANLSTDESFTQKHLKNQEEKLNQFMQKMIASVRRKNIQSNEEFIFNAISCSTNIMFYDVPHRQILTFELRVNMFHSLKNYLLITQNEELQVEAVRVLSNLSRHSDICNEFVNDKNFLEAICIVLDHTLRDLVFYAIGIIINITLHEQLRPNVLDKGVIPKLIDVLKDSNIEDMELSKVAAKALHNIAGENAYWSIESIKKLDEVLSSLGEELDSIMDVANEEEMEEIKSLRDMVNALINDMPEAMFNCTDQKCGRKFRNKEELEKHVERRHNSQQKQ